MKRDSVKVGTRVKVNRLPDSQVYTVESIEGFIAQLVYETEHGETVSGGAMDVSVLIKA